MRLIDAEQATDILCRVAMANTDRKIRDTIIEIAYELQNPSTFPTVEPPPVVRCKDCKHSKLIKLKGYVKCGLLHDVKPYDWFCIDGERREVTE